jgi:hypothetical protein
MSYSVPSAFALLLFFIPLSFQSPPAPLLPNFSCARPLDEDTGFSALNYRLADPIFLHVRKLTRRTTMQHSRSIRLHRYMEIEGNLIDLWAEQVAPTDDIRISYNRPHWIIVSDSAIQVIYYLEFWDSETVHLEKVTQTPINRQ